MYDAKGKSSKQTCLQPKKKIQKENTSTKSSSGVLKLYTLG